MLTYDLVEDFFFFLITFAVPFQCSRHLFVLSVFPLIIKNRRQYLFAAIDLKKKNATWISDKVINSALPVF